MSNEQRFDYYIVSGNEAEDLLRESNTIYGKRKEVIAKVLELTGAVTHTFSNGCFSKKSLINQLVWSVDYEFPCAISVKGRDVVDGKDVVIAKGKGNTKAGKEFNKSIESIIKHANITLSDLPVFSEMIINHYGVMRVGYGDGCMFSTRAGTSKNHDGIILFAIPNGEGDNPVRIPECFEKISYGRFYDLANKE